MDNFGFHLEPLRAILYQIGAYLPRLLVALVVVFAGWLIAKVVRFAVIKALRAFNFNVLTERSGLDNFWRQGGLMSCLLYTSQSPRDLSTSRMPSSA